MVSELDLRGVWIPLITPFDATGAVDIPTIETLCAEYIAAGATGIVALGTTGESSALDHDEKKAVIDACARAAVVPPRASPLIVGTGTNSTRTTTTATEALRGHRRRGRGVGGRAVLCPAVGSGNRRPPRGRGRREPGAGRLLQHPGRDRRGLGADSILALAAHPKIAGVKQAVAALDVDTLGCSPKPRRGSRCSAVKTRCCSRLMCMGGGGTISASAHVVTERFVAMIECGLVGKIDDGRAHAESLLLPLVRARLRGTEPPRCARACSAGSGPDPDPRSPCADDQPRPRAT